MKNITNNISILLFIFIIAALDTSAAISDNISSSDRSSLISDSSSSMAVRSAGDLIGQIKEGKAIDIDHARIVGEFNLSSLNIKSPISIRDSVVSDFANLSFSNFDFINFEGTIFQDDATFQSTIFNQVSWFTRTQFKESAYFTQSIFYKEANFNMARFVGPLYFYDSRFLGYSDFKESKFNDLAFFWRTQFLSGADFERATFDGKAYFVEAIFFGQYNPYHFTYYDWQRMQRGGAFQPGDLQGCVNFEDAVFNGLAYFNGAHFSGNVSLGNAKIYSMDLGSAIFEENSKLDLIGSSFIRLIIPWDQIRDHLALDGSVYMALLKNYKDQQKFTDADACYYDYKARTHSGFFDTLALLSCGYGVRPIVPLVDLGILVFLCGVLLFPGYGLSGFYFSAATVLSVPMPEFRPEGYYRILTIVEKFLGYMLLALFLVTLGNVMIR